MMLKSTSESNIQNNKREYWKTILNSYENSGLTQRVFCNENQISHHTFSYWRTQFRSNTSKSVAQNAKMTFVTTKIKQEDTIHSPFIPQIQIKIRNACVNIFTDVGLDLLRTVLKALGED